MIKLEKIDHLDLEQTFLCGQCFRWEKDENGVFYGIAGDSVAKMYYKQPNSIYIESSNPDLKFWSHYLNLSCDYNLIGQDLSKDDVLLPCVNAGKGIRILRQDLWETIVSFIISANNNIPRIKKIINMFCKLYGTKIEFDGKIFYGFPKPETIAALNLEDLSEIRAGFRDKYILDAAKKVVSGEINLGKLPQLSNEESKKELMKINGIGPKVADGILLFALGRHDIFPYDVWTKRIIADIYGTDEKDLQRFVSEKFGRYAGIAQQYLYYYYAIKKNNS